MQRWLEARDSDFFRINASGSALAKALDMEIDAQTKAVILDLQAGEQPLQGVRAADNSTAVVPFARASAALVRLALDPVRHAARGRYDVKVLVPRRPFDKVTDDNGVGRINALSLSQGSAIGDEILENLGASLALAIDLAEDAKDVTVREIAAALIIHIGIQYGGMSLPGVPATGGLAPWQLQLAKTAFGEHPGKPIVLADVAASCGLTLNHFARAFARSTGTSPHAWLLQRRIDSAKDLILHGTLSLAEIALACGFSDQSHLTRTFSRMVDLTPGNWRKSQLQ